jgi:hypothetical protein
VWVVRVGALTDTTSDQGYRTELSCQLGCTCALPCTLAPTRPTCYEFTAGEGFRSAQAVADPGP